MGRALTFNEAQQLCCDSLALADAVERAGGPAPHQAARFYRARQALEQVADELNGSDLGFAPLALIPWLLFGAATVVGVATVPTLISESRRVAGAVGTGTASIVTNVSRVTNLALYGALAFGGWWAAKQITKGAA